MANSNIRILLVQAGQIHVQPLRDALQAGEGSFTWSCVESLSAALEQLASQPYDLILLDLDAPGGPELESIRELRRQAPHLPLIALSTQADEITALQALRAGAQDILVKSPTGYADAARALRFALARFDGSGRVPGSDRPTDSGRAFNSADPAPQPGIVDETSWLRVIERTQTAIVLVSREGRILYGSPQASAILGYPTTTLLGHSVFDLVPSENLVSARQMFEQFLVNPGQPIQAQVRLLRRDGSLCWVEATVTNCLEETGLDAVVLNFCDVTQRVQAEEELHKSEVSLRESEAFLRMANEAAELGIWRHDLQTLRLRLDERSQLISGFTKPDVSLEEIASRVHPDDLAGFQQAFDAHLDPSSLGVFASEFRLNRQDGQVRWLAARGRAVFEGEGSERRAVVAYGTVRDITDSRQAQEQLAQSEERNRLLFETMAQGVVFNDADGVIVTANPAACKILGLTLDQLQGRTSLDPHWHAIHEDGSPFPGETHPAMLALRSGQPVYDVVMGVFNPAADNYRWVNITAIPQFHLGQTQPYQVYATFEDITARKQVEEELRRSELNLRESEEFLRLANEATEMGIWRHNPLTGQLHLDERARQLYGFPSPDISMAELTSHINPADYARVQQALTAAMVPTTNGKFTIEYRITCPDGRERWLALRGQAVFEGEGDARRMVVGYGTVMDTTERKLADQALLEQLRLQEQLENTASVVPGMLHTFRQDPQGHLSMPYSSQAIEDIYGIPHQSVEQDAAAVLSLIDPRDLTHVIESIHESGRSKRPWRQEYRIQHPVKGLRWLEGHSTPVLSPDGSILWHGIILDITARKQAEEELRRSELSLRESEEFLRLAVEATEMGIWRHDLSTNQLHMDERARQLYGFPSPDVKLDDVMSRIHLDDLAQVQEAIAALQDPVSQGKFVTEYRIIGPDGRTHWLSVRGRMTSEVEGSPRRSRISYGTVMDITERRLAEEELRRSEFSLRQSQDDLAEAQRISRLGSWHYNLATDTVSWSDEVYRVFDLEKSEFNGRYRNFITKLHPADRARVMEHGQAVRETGAPFEMEYRILTRDGGEKHIREVGYSRKDANGVVTDLYGTAQDVTERKRTEAFLHAQLRLAQAIGQFDDPTDGFRLCLETILELSGLDSGGIYLFDEERAYLNLVYHQGVSADFIQTARGYPASSPNAQLILSGKPSYFTLDLKEVLEAETLLNEGLQSLAVLPIFFQNLVVGCINLSSHSLAEIPEETQELLEKLAIEIGNFAVHMRAQAALRASEEKYRGLIESMDSVLATVDADGYFLFMNDVAAQQLNSHPADLIGKTMFELFPGQYADRQMANIRKVIREDQAATIESQIMVHGQLRWYRTVLQPLHDENGQVKQVLVNSVDIQALKAAQQELQELNRTLEERVKQRTAEVQDLYNNAPIGYHSIDGLGRFTMINQTELNWLGYTREEMTGHSVHEFLTETSWQAFQGHFPTFKQTGILRDLELDFIRKDGSTIATLVNAVAIYDEQGRYLMSRSTLFDNTARKQAETALRESETQNRLLFEEAPEAILLTDGEGRVVQTNRAFEILTGIPGWKSAGRSVQALELFTEETAALADAAYQSFENGENYAALEFCLKHSSGQLVDVSARVFALQLHNRQHFLISMRDITKEKQVEETLRRANHEMERAMRMKDEFLASMSHELRTPLTGILGISEGLQDLVYGPLNEKQMRSLKNIETSGRHLLDLINDILDLSKLEAGKLVLDIISFPLSQVCRSSVQMVRGMAGKKNQQIALRMVPEELIFQGDARRIKQILVNLLSNAVKYTSEGGSIGLDVEANPTNQTVTFTVWDTGIGIKPGDLDRLFQPFVQLDSSLSRMQSGTGLGLSLVQDLVALHGGSVSVQSEFGKGSRFIVTMPLVPTANLSAPSASPSQPASPAKEPASAPASPPALARVMVVEDDELNRSIVCEYLRAKGYEIACARDGFQFLDQVADVSPDVILMDIQMPGADGMEVIRRLRSHPNARVAALPVIAITALAMVGDRERCLAAGANDYISKPFQLNMLVETIQGLTGRH